MSLTDRPMPRTLRETADQEPFRFYERMRAAGPVTWDESMGSWLVTSHAACKEVQHGEEQAYRHAYLDMGSDVFVEVEGGPRNLLFLPGRGSPACSPLLLRLLNPNEVEAHREALVRPLVHSLMDQFAPTGSAELVDEFAELLPVRVIAALMDLPYRDEEWIRSCKHCMEEIAVFLEAFAVDDDDVVRRATAASKVMNGLPTPYINARRDGDGDDRRPQRPGVRGRRRTPTSAGMRSMRANVRIIFFGGSDTTTQRSCDNAFDMRTHDRSRTRRLGARAGPGKLLIGSSRRRCGSTARSISGRGSPTTTSSWPGARSAPTKRTPPTVNMAANRDPEIHHPSPTVARLDRTMRRDHLAFYSGLWNVYRRRARSGRAAGVDRGVPRTLPRRPPASGAEPPRFQGFLMRSTCSLQRASRRRRRRRDRGQPGAIAAAGDRGQPGRSRAAGRDLAGSRA